MDREGGRLQAGLLGVGGLEDLDLVVVLLGPADVHPHQRLGEVGGVDAPGAGADGDQRLAHVVLAVEQGADLEALHGLGHPAELALRLGDRVLVALLLAELDEDPDVLDPALQLEEAVQGALEEGELAGHARGVVLVVPEVRSGHLVAEVLDLLAHAVEVQDLTDGVHRRLELLDLGLEVWACHMRRLLGEPCGTTNASCCRLPARASSPSYTR